MTAIQVTHLDVAYEQRTIINNLNLEFPKGKISIIIGSNGSGKSTLLKTVARIIKPKKGSIIINGKDVRKQTGKHVAKQVAVLPQNPIAPQGLLVKELVAYGRFPYQKAMGGLNEHDHAIIQWAIKETGLSGFQDCPIDNLSGGQRQRAWIAMALAQETEILLLDEPTTYLDISYQLEILQLLQQLNQKEKRTIVMVLHDLNLASRFADHIVGVKSGEVIFSGPPKDVINPQNLYQIYGIKAKMELNETGDYPICVEYDF